MPPRAAMRLMAINSIDQMKAPKVASATPHHLHFLCSRSAVATNSGSAVATNSERCLSIIPLA